MVYRDPGDQPQMGFMMPTVTPVVRWLLWANVAVFVVQTLWTVIHAPSARVFEEVFMINPVWWKELYFPIYQLGTYAFLHGGMWHIFGNLLSLFFFGTRLEGIVGSRRFAVFYGTAVVLGGVAHLLGAFLWAGLNPALGASGGTMAVLIAVAVMQPHSMVLIIMFPVKLWILAAFFVFQDSVRLLDGVLNDRSDGVAYMVHLAGMLVGFVGVKKGLIWRDPIAAAQTKREERKVQQQRDDDARMDELLAKIHREGMSALTKAEKEFLNRMSKR